MRQFSLAGPRLPWAPGALESLRGGPCEGVSVAPAVPSSLIPAWRGEGCPEQGCDLWVFIPCLPARGTSSSTHQHPESPRAGGSLLASRDHTRIHTHNTWAHTCIHMCTHPPTHTQAHTHTHTPGVPAGSSLPSFRRQAPASWARPPSRGAGPHPRTRTRRGCPPTLGRPHRSLPSAAVSVSPGQT